MKLVVVVISVVVSVGWPVYSLIRFKKLLSFNFGVSGVFAYKIVPEPLSRERSTEADERKLFATILLFAQTGLMIW